MHQPAAHEGHLLSLYSNAQHHKLTYKPAGLIWPWFVLAQTLDLGEVYLGLPKEHYIYKLRSMVCYYGAHYHAFVHTGGQWIMFDDANTSAVGSWDAVMHKCQLGKIQPSVLFFELPSQA